MAANLTYAQLLTADSNGQWLFNDLSSTEIASNTSAMVLQNLFVANSAQVGTGDSAETMPITNFYSQAINLVNTQSAVDYAGANTVTSYMAQWNNSTFGSSGA